MPYEYNPFTNNLDLVQSPSNADVVGPGSSTDDALVRWDGTSGTAIKNSNATLTDAGVLSLTSPLLVSSGGTGVSSNTAYAVLCGGTTATGAVQSIASVGSSGQVLTSNGAGALPTFQNSGGGGGAVPSQLFTDSAVYFPLRGWSSTSYGITTDRLELIPIMVNKSMTLSAIGGYFAGSNAGATSRFGLYSQNPSTAAFTLISDYGTVDNSSAGMLTISISETLDPSILYWFAFVSNENGGSFSMQGVGTLSPAYMMNSSGQPVRGIYKDSVGVGALASSYAFSDFTLNTGSSANPVVQALYD